MLLIPSKPGVLFRYYLNSSGMSYFVLSGFKESDVWISPNLILNSGSTSPSIAYYLNIFKDSCGLINE